MSGRGSVRFLLGSTSRLFLGSAGEGTEDGLGGIAPRSGQRGGQRGDGLGTKRAAMKSRSAWSPRPPSLFEAKSQLASPSL